MKERADVFDGISLLSSPFCSSFFFSLAINREKTSTKRERGESYVIKVYSSSSLKREQKRDNAQ